MKSTCIRDLLCVACQRAYPAGKVGFTCPACGPINGVLEVRYDPVLVCEQFSISDLVNAPSTQWRYGPLLPLEKRHAGAGWPVGWTPVMQSPSLARAVGVRSLLLKDEGRGFTGSMADRALSITAIRASDVGSRGIACCGDSRIGVSMAAFATLAGLQAYVLAGADSAPERDSYAEALGAHVIPVKAPPQQINELCRQACERFGWYPALPAYNPYLIEGLKTAGMEIAEQCFAEPPDWVVVGDAIGDGATITAIAKGLDEMVEAEIIDWRPRILGVQFAGVVAENVATNLVQMTGQIERFEGSLIHVSQTEADEAQRMLARQTGLLCESGALPIAGMKRATADGLLRRSDHVLAVLHDRGRFAPTDSTAHSKNTAIEPTVAAVEEFVQAHAQPASTALGSPLNR